LKKLNPASDDAGFVGKFKALWKKYGWVFVGTYATVWATTLSTFYVLVDQGFMQTKDFDEDAVPNPLNPLELLKKVRRLSPRAIPTQRTLVRCKVDTGSRVIIFSSTRARVWLPRQQTTPFARSPDYTPTAALPCARG